MLKFASCIATRRFAKSTLLVCIAGVAVVFSMAIAPAAIGVLGAGLAIVMIAIAAIDLRHYIIPDSLNAAGFGLAIIHAVALDPDMMLSAAALATLRGLVLALLFLALRQLYALARGRTGLGLGDVKLAAVAGAWLNWSTIPITIEIATLTALSGYLLRQYVLRRPIAATGRLPFGFFFAPAIWIGWILQWTWLAPL